ncbi:unnamed protein product [Pleuronectes platessa]|uniref:Uncharacterized protein n=1 Tax=Pleuronectes platessa TaxID=8262 RepID=A0A9N7U4M4_PLEPL|nr:unnamed protein product [Pleuronectes platessa]
MCPLVLMEDSSNRDTIPDALRGSVSLSPSLAPVSTGSGGYVNRKSWMSPQFFPLTPQTLPEGGCLLSPFRRLSLSLRPTRWISGYTLSYHMLNRVEVNERKKMSAKTSWGRQLDRCVELSTALVLKSLLLLP